MVPDGTPPPPGHLSATEWWPTARPGHHVPHVWLARGSERVSTSDLVSPTGLTLFVDASSSALWQDAVAGRPDRVTVVTVGDALVDDTGEWANVRGTRPTGAVLVRPDRHVAWRVAVAPADPAAELQAVLDRLLRTPPATGWNPADSLAGITEAGEALRVTAARAPQLFTVTD
ncbi:unannotated protein [freshwater metagenome]|uniref:Unannotated protein n=1 Tax=freshwater metagenome TaxID=449393 RepID=A0A6J7IUM6_9ZZZZ